MRPSDPFDTSIIISSLTGEATDEEIRELQAWRARSATNEREYLQFVRLWLSVGEPPSPTEPIPPPNAKAVIDRANQEERDDQQHAVRRRMRVPWTGAWRGAAAAVTVGFALATWSWLREKPFFGAESLVTGLNEVATVTLQDQTVVRLAPSSRLTFGSGDVRQVSLSGRAFFAVAENPDRPFRVHLSSGAIEVLGTRFDVDSRGADLQVAVVEGVVRMQVRDESLELTANQVASVPEDGAVDVRTVVDPFEVIGWLDTFVAFEATPLQQVADEFERRFGIQLEIADGALLSRTITGWFTDQTPEMMIGAICTVVGAQCEVSGDVVTMMLNGSGVAGAGESM